MAFKINLKKLKLVGEVNAGRGPQPDIEANKKLATDYAGMPENGLTMSDLVAKYGSSPKNLYERLERMGVPRHRKVEVKNKPFWEGNKNGRKTKN